jgi:TolB-like protein/tetratricopeptide (TPR) repeat protein
VHRDIKPENVLLEEGHAVISDFGIARAVSAAGGETATEAGVAVGTPLYMSPEQGAGEPELDTRSDVYSLGCCVWEMLAGDPPYTGPTAQAVLARKAAEPLPFLRAVRETVPEEVEGVISKALAKVPADRYSTAHEFQRALARGMRKSAQFRAVRQRRRFYALAALAGIIAVAVIVQLIRGPQVRLKPNRVVVGTFDNQSGDPELAAFGGIAADIVTQGLMGSENLDVVPSVSARGAWEYVQGQLAEGRVRDPVRALAQETGAGIVVTGTYYRIGDTVMMQGAVTDGENGRPLGSIQPVHGPADDPVGPVQEVRDQIAGLLAVTRDERLAPSVGAASRPPSYEAYRAFSDGMELYVREQWADAVPYFARGYALDSTFVRSLLYEALSYNNYQAWPEADSVLRIAARSRHQLTAYDRLFLDYRIAFYAIDHESALRAITRAAEIAPGSKAEYNLALELFESNHPRQSRETLERLDPTRGPMRDWLPYWRVLSGSHHLERNHQQERRVAQRARRILSDQLGALHLEVRGVAAVGQADEVAALLAEARRISDDASGESVADLTAVAAMELRVHGYPEEAAEMFQRAATSYEGLPREALSTRARAQYARVLYALDRWDAAWALDTAVAAENPARIDYRARLGLNAARRGDTAAAEEIETWLAGLSDQYLYGEHTYYRAAIAAVLGEREEAVNLLREAFGQGWPQGSMRIVHPDFDFESLFDYPPYVELMEPKP